MSNRKQQVVLNGVSSDLKELRAGVSHSWIGSLAINKPIRGIFYF